MPVKSNPRGRSMERLVATTHEYLLLFAKNPDAVQILDNDLTEEQLGEYNKSDPDLGPYRLIELRNRNPEFHRGNRPNLHYPIYYDASTNEFDLEFHDGWEEIRPKTSKGKDAVWRWSKEKLLANRDRIVIKRVKREENPYNVYKKDFLQHAGGELRRSKHKTFLDDSAYNYQNGKRIVRDMFGEALFGNPKPLALIDKCLAMANLEPGSIVMDFFAGSGTTGHVVIDRMRLTGIKINYILVEIGQIFYDALLPRLKKASFAREWKNGQPQDTDGVPHTIKYLTLESFDDVLEANISSLKAEGKIP
jgi:adenine-specific DNA-methyltransferase